MKRRKGAVIHTMPSRIKLIGVTPNPPMDVGIIPDTPNSKYWSRTISPDGLRKSMKISNLTKSGPPIVNPTKIERLSTNSGQT